MSRAGTGGGTKVRREANPAGHPRPVEEEQAPRAGLEGAGGLHVHEAAGGLEALPPLGRLPLPAARVLALAQDQLAPLRLGRQSLLRFRDLRAFE